MTILKVTTPHVWSPEDPVTCVHCGVKRDWWLFLVKETCYVRLIRDTGAPVSLWDDI